ncbi:MAG: ABC transporter ATP-binding protein [Trueperaceae bacterium]
MPPEAPTTPVTPTTPGTPEAPGTPVAIRFSSVSKTYGDVVAVRDLDLTIYAGEFVVLLGPSGCGKTTTLRMINRLITPSSGTIQVNGADVTSQDLQELRRGIGYVIQAVGLFPHLTVGQNVQVVPRLLGWSRERRRARSRELLALVGLEPAEYLDRYPQDLSGGEQQRVGVARALAADPPVLLMDEPFGAVDPITRDRLQEEFLELQRRLRKTVVFVTHDLDEAIRLADRVCLMREGAVEQFAPPERLLSAPATEFVERFVGSGRALKRLSRLAVAGIMRPAAGAAHVASVTPSADLRTALSSFLEHGASELDVVDEGGERVGELVLDDIVALGKQE